MHFDRKSFRNITAGALVLGGLIFHASAFIPGQDPAMPVFASDIVILSDTVYNSREIVLNVQNKLNEAGYNCGYADGIMGWNTIAAIQNYQMVNKLPVTGNINDELLYHLGLSRFIDTSKGTQILDLLKKKYGAPEGETESESVDRTKRDVETETETEPFIDYEKNFDDLYEYVQKQGEALEDGGYLLSLEGDDHVTYLHAVAAPGRQLILYSAHSESPGGMAELFYDLTLTLEKGAQDAYFSASRNLRLRQGSQISTIDAFEEGTILLSDCAKEAAFVPSSYRKTDTDFYGNVTETTDPAKADMDKDIAVDYGNLIRDLPSILKKTGLGLTLSDLGFTAL